MPGSRRSRRLHQASGGGTGPCGPSDPAAAGATPGGVPSVDPLNDDEAPPSALGAGDCGGRYQDQVGGWLLGLLLIAGRIPEGTSSVARVGFQRKAQGAVIDDVVVTTSDGYEVQYSVKASIKIQVSNPELEETLSLAWSLFASDKGSGLIAPPLAMGLRSLEQVLFLAKRHDRVEDFMAAIAPGTLRQEHRRRGDACRTLLDRINEAPLTDEQFWKFLRSFDVVHVDFDLPPSTHRSTFLAMLAAVQQIGDDAAEDLFQRLVSEGELFSITGAQVARDELLARSEIVNGFEARFV
jgi:hypothetical protein